MNRNDLIELDQIIRKYNDDEIGVDYVHGMLTAFLSAPQMIMPNVVRSAVIGEGNVIDSRDDMEAFDTHLMTLYNEIGEQMIEQALTPVLTISKRPKDYTYKDAEDWCRGYLEATTSYISPEECEEDEELCGLIFPITLLAAPEDVLADGTGELMKRDGIDSEEVLLSSFEELPDIALDICYHNRPELMGDISALENKSFQQQKQKIGRNDPCPCGSGKKYKKCCGS